MADAKSDMARERQIRAEQVRILHTGALATFLASFFNAGLLVFVQREVIAPTVVYGWLAYILAVMAGRAGLVVWYRRASEADRVEQAERWERLYTVGTALAGLAWGAAGLLLYAPASPAHQAFLAFVIGGMAAGGAAVLFPSLPSAASYIALTLLPTAIPYVRADDVMHQAMGAMVLLYLLMLLGSAVRTNHNLRVAIGLRFENEDLVRGLRGEIDQRRQVEAVLRSSEEQLRHAQKMEAVGKLAGGVAHEFNNLLQVIRGYCFFLQDEAGPRSPMSRDIEAIQDTVDRASNLTSQLLAFSRRQVAMPRVLDLNAQIMEQYRMLKRLIGEDIVLDVQLEPRLGLIKADPTQVGQVLLNLVNNARDAMPKGGTLTISTGHRTLPESETPATSDTPPVPYVALMVTDTGAGIPPEILDRIFEPFFTTKEVGKGTGLGLSTVYGLVTQAGGQIRVQSQADKGSTFSVYWPRVSEEVAEPVSAVVPEPVPRASATVLLVEDDEAVRRQLRLALERQGYQVLEAGDGRQALHVAAGHVAPIHLLVTDMVMPNLGGRELAAQLTAARPALRTIYVSGFSAGVEDQVSLAGSAATYLKKPFTPDRLVRTAHALLRAES